MEKIKFKIGIYSAKGGVGKTTIAVNLAVALAKQGKKVGFLDADIDCPNAHILFGLNEKPNITDGNFTPLERYGVKIVSMSMIIDDDSAVLWRGPMISKAMNDLLLMTDWSDIDYLIVDMPPGTSDGPITVMQTIPEFTGFIGITTPQVLSAADLKRSISMLSDMGIPLIGIVENMCSEVFGCSNEEKYIAHIPLVSKVVKGEDEGIPAVIYDKRLIEIYDKIIESIEK